MNGTPFSCTRGGNRLQQQQPFRRDPNGLSSVRGRAPVLCVCGSHDFLFFFFWKRKRRRIFSAPRLQRTYSVNIIIHRICQVSTLSFARCWTTDRLVAESTRIGKFIEIQEMRLSVTKAVVSICSDYSQVVENVIG